MAAEAREKSSTFLAWTTALGSMATVVVGVATCYTLYQSIQEDKKSEAAVRLLVDQSTYSMAVTNQRDLMLSASQSALTPTSVEVSPIFDMGLVASEERTGEPVTYRFFQTDLDGGKKTVVIPGVYNDICSVTENSDSCRDFGILEFKVEYQFGEYRDFPRVGYVPL